MPTSPSPRALKTRQEDRPHWQWLQPDPRIVSLSPRWLQGDVRDTHKLLGTPCRLCASRGHLDRDHSDHRLLGHVCPQQLGFARQSPILRCTDDVFGGELVRFSQKLLHFRSIQSGIGHEYQSVKV